MKREEELARRRSELPEAKKALLAERLQRSLQRKTLYVSIKKRESDQKMVLSFAQQRLWFLDQLAPGNPFYNMPLVIYLDGLLDVLMLFRCLQELVWRHESLRTNFVMNGDEPVQMVTGEDRLSLPVIDLQDTREEQQLQAVQQLSETEAQRPFDLSNGALMRSTLLRLKPQKHLLLMTMHHIISDGWSMGILYHEMTVLYQALREGSASPLPPLPLQYADYALWQREWLQGELLQKQLAYWHQQLANLAPLDLPIDHPRLPLQTFRGSLLSFTLPADLVQKIRALCRQEGITLFIVLLSAFQMVLARYTGLDDIAVGTPIAGRTKVELEGLVGFFVNTLVIRTNLSGNPSLRDILHTVRNVAEAAFNHQDVPFEKLVEELRPERNVSQNPLIQTLFSLRIPVDNTRDIAQLRLRVKGQESQTTQFDLMLTMSEVQDSIVGQFQYNTNLFDISTIQRIAEHFSALLQAIVDTPQQTLWDTPILSYEEQRKMLHAWNATQCDYPQDRRVHQLFEQQVEQTPEAIAVVFDAAGNVGTRTGAVGIVPCADPVPTALASWACPGFTPHLTYQQLNSQANQLAYRLQQMGIGPEVPVGVCMERSLELVVALLAVLKAGGAYVPLDPAYPQERFTFLFEDTQVPVVLTQAHLRDRMGLVGLGPASDHRLLLNVKVICLEASPPSISSLEERGNPACLVQPDNLAYLIYTSGSTGKPKGVMNTHRGICNHLSWMQQTYQLTQEDRVLQKTPYSFDVSVWEFLLPLTMGAGLVVASPGGHQDPAYLNTLIAEERVSMLHFVPSMLQVFLEELNQQSGESLRHVLCGGEMLTASLQDRFFAHVGEEVQLSHLYGPTEATIDVASRQCQRRVVDRDSKGEACPHLEGPRLDPGVPIGCPIANTQIYLLDRNQQPVPIGVPAELYIGGEGLARGYYRRPGLTAEKFIPNPFVGTGLVPVRVEGERLYRTGDLARYRADGTIEYLGRVDSQVKLRGYRIELGEIEATLQGHPVVQEAVVVLHKEDETREYLAAYVVVQREEQVTPQALQYHLREQLPDYMVPAIFIYLEALPLTPNGKINRKALPVPTRTAQSFEGYVAPQSEIEQTLVAIWQQVLGLEHVGIYDNFFDLGGHSLLLIQVRSKLETYLGYGVPIVDLFQYPTIHTLSIYLSGRQEQQPPLQLIAERVEKRKAALQKQKRTRVRNER
jgi:amino acid adenylation domain-containing protein